MIKNIKKIHLAFGGVVVLGGLILWQVGGQKAGPPHIDSISPTSGGPNAVVTITGSGFTAQLKNCPLFETSEQCQTKIKNVIMPPGNYLRTAGGGTMGAPSFSSDGKTLQFQLQLNEGEVKNCPVGGTSKQCEISLQVVNGNGAPSNIVHYQVVRPLP